MWSRRQLAHLAAGGLLLPRTVFGQSAGQKRFIFLFSDGGWDTGHVFTPWWDVVDAGVEPDAQPGRANGIDFVDHPHRPSVREFFENWGDQACVINGLEVRSITHERCRQLMLTGQGPLSDDWASILAARSVTPLQIPHVIVDGPAFTDRFTSGVVRVGDDDQLPRLLSGDALTELGLTVPTSRAQSLTDAFVAQRAANRGTAFSNAYADTLDQLAGLTGLGDLGLSVEDAGCERDIAADCGLAFDLFSRDISRCAMLRYKGWCSERWDTHQGLELQSTNFEDLFAYLNAAMLDLSGRSSSTGGALADEVVFVLFSEMGREPKLNAWEGRDHWTFTSVMLVGAGVQGGQVIGGLDSGGQGQAVDLGTGAISGSGTSLLPEHLGATLLQLGDVDPAEFLDAPAPITAALS